MEFSEFARLLASRCALFYILRRVSSSYADGFGRLLELKGCLTDSTLEWFSLTIDHGRTLDVPSKAIPITRRSTASNSEIWERSLF